MQSESSFLQPFSAHLYRNVLNGAEIRKLVLTKQIPCCLLKPKYVLDTFQMEMVVKKALHNQKEGKMRTRTLPTEIIYLLSPSKNISESLQTFGIADEDTEILFLYYGTNFYEMIGNIVKGDEVPIDRVKEFSNVPAITNMYGISQNELLNSSLVDSVISRIASKEFVTV